MARLVRHCRARDILISNCVLRRIFQIKFNGKYITQLYPSLVRLCLVHFSVPFVDTGFPFQLSQFPHTTNPIQWHPLALLLVPIPRANTPEL